MSTLILAQVPDTHVPATVAANELALIRVDDDIVDRDSVRVVTLDAGGASIPDLDGAVFGASDHPFPLAVECDAGDVGGVTFESEDGVGVRGFEVVELDVLVSCGCEKALVGRDAEAVDLRVGMLDRSKADSRQGFPEAGPLLELCRYIWPGI